MVTDDVLGAEAEQRTAGGRLGEREVVDLDPDRHLHRKAVGTHSDGAFVDPGAGLPRRPNQHPQRLVRAGRHRDATRKRRQRIRPVAGAAQLIGGVRHRDVAHPQHLDSRARQPVAGGGLQFPSQARRQPREVTIWSHDDLRGL